MIGRLSQKNFGEYKSKIRNILSMNKFRVQEGASKDLIFITKLENGDRATFGLHLSAQNLPSTPENAENNRFHGATLLDQKKWITQQDKTFMNLVRIVFVWFMERAEDLLPVSSSASSAQVMEETHQALYVVQVLLFAAYLGAKEGGLDTSDGDTEKRYATVFSAFLHTIASSPGKVIRFQHAPISSRPVDSSGCQRKRRKFSKQKKIKSTITMREAEKAGSTTLLQLGDPASPQRGKANLLVEYKLAPVWNRWCAYAQETLEKLGAHKNEEEEEETAYNSEENDHDPEAHEPLELTGLSRVELVDLVRVLVQEKKEKFDAKKEVRALQTRLTNLEKQALTKNSTGDAAIFRSELEGVSAIWKQKLEEQQDQLSELRKKLVEYDSVVLHNLGNKSAVGSTLVQIKNYAAKLRGSSELNVFKMPGINLYWQVEVFISGEYLQSDHASVYLGLLNDDNSTPVRGLLGVSRRRKASIPTENLTKYDVSERSLHFPPNLRIKCKVTIQLMDSTRHSRNFAEFIHSYKRGEMYGCTQYFELEKLKELKNAGPDVYFRVIVAVLAVHFGQ